MARKVASWLKKVLPDNYAQKQAEFHQMEAFLKQFFKTDIYNQFQLMSCASKRVVLAAKSPQAAGYLKLQQQALEFDMKTQLNVDYRILIKTNPKSLHSGMPKKVIQPKAIRSKQAALSLEQVSLSVNDEALQASLQRLAKSLAKKNIKLVDLNFEYYCIDC